MSGQYGDNETVRYCQRYHCRIGIFVPVAGSNTSHTDAECTDKTIALKSEKCSFINPLYEVIVSHPSASPLRYMADSANSLLIFLAMGRLDSEIKMIAV